MSKSVDLNNYSPETIEEAFLNAYDSVARYHYITTYEVEVPPDNVDGVAEIVVEVSAMADTPTDEEYAKITDLQRIEVKMLDGTAAVFELAEIVYLNGTEYNAIYRVEE